MQLIYTSLLFLSILGFFLLFVWIVVKTGNQATYQIAMEPQLAPSSSRQNESYMGGKYARNIETAYSRRYADTEVQQEEDRLMNEIDNIKDKHDLKEWFELLKVGYKNKNIPKRVYLRVSTMLNGYIWFEEAEYAKRIQEGKPVQKVTEREYALEKKLESLTSKN